MPRRLSHFAAKINRRAVHGSESTESEHQQALFSWLSDTEELQTDPVKREALHWCHAIPNQAGRAKPFITRSGRQLPPLEAVRLKAEGVKAGIFDLRLDYQVLFTPPDVGKTGSPIPCIVCPGLIIEMKSDKGKLSPEQVHYQRYMASQHVVCRVCRTWQGAARAIAGYMQLEKIAPVFVKDDDRYVITIDDPLILQSLEGIKE